MEGKRIAGKRKRTEVTVTALKKRAGSERGKAGEDGMQSEGVKWDWQGTCSWTKLTFSRISGFFSG